MPKASVKRLIECKKKDKLIEFCFRYWKISRVCSFLSYASKVYDRKEKKKI